MSAPVFTIGHSTRAWPELLALLQEAGVERLVDVRRFPQSRRHPQFGHEALAAALAQAGLGYLHEEDLGGHRPPRPDSDNGGWRNDALRGYADHMDGAPFRAALERLLAEPRRTVVMCAEADPRRCHRQLLADALLSRGRAVTHLLGPGLREPHVLHPLARVDAQGRLRYPPPAPRQRGLFEP